VKTDYAEPRPKPSRQRARFRRNRRRILLFAAVAVAVVAVGWGMVAAFNYEFVDQDQRLPHHWVTITNDTSKTISWTCTWSDLNLSPGQTGSIEILNDPDQDFGCGHDDQGTWFIPSIDDMKSGSHFTVSDWLKHDESP
jgi:hypothetical protein